jgi:hypothetical protein
MDAAYALCSKLVAHHGAERVTINLSAGTKIMALGAYECARECAIPAYYVDTNNGHVLNVTTRVDTRLPTFDVGGYLACFGRSPVATLDPSHLQPDLATSIRLAAALADGGAPACRALERIRRHGQGKGRRTCTIKNYAPSEEEQRVWQLFTSYGALAAFDHAGGTVTFTVPSDSAFHLLSGAWLELFVGDQARQLTDRRGEPLFTDVLVGFEIPSDETGARKEIDVGMMYQSQLIHCSCKTGSTNPWSTDYLDELRAVSSLIGGRFCSRIFVTNQAAPVEGDSASKDFRRFLNQAKDREIVVVTGEQLVALPDVLRREAVKPTYQRI